FTMFGSTWGNQNQQQQQQQQQPGAFGQPSAFGSNTGTSTFGSSAFGQPQQQQQQQQQQPQVNPMFGNLPAPSSTNPSSGFGAHIPSLPIPLLIQPKGAFGSTSNTSAFGQPKPATGFGAFSGGTSAFGSTPSAFGQTNNAPSTGTSVFGQQSNSSTTSAFGSTSAFGANKPATSVFGSTSATSSTANNGTGGIPYAPFTEKDPGTSAMLQYQAITGTPAYRNFSFEELRIQDYAQNRKTASTGAFGTGSAFGSTQPATTNVFGSQANQPAQGGVFGGGSTPTNTGGGFGAFGQNTQQANTQPTGGVFGGGSAFGQQSQQQQPQTSGSIFGGTSAFGTQSKPSVFGTTPSAFGSTAPTTSAFGGTNTGTSAFGQTTQPAQQQTSIFGNTQPAQSGFSAFGATNQQKPSIFGSTTTQPANTGTSIFGTQNQPNQQQQQQAAQPASIFGTSTGGSIFGNTGTTQTSQPATQPTTSLFGNTQPANTGTSIFGGGTGTSLFGNATNQQQQPGTQQPAQTGGFGNLFGNKPAGTTPSLFSSTTPATTQPQTSLFGNTQTTTQPSLFGPKPAAPALGGSTSGQTGLFGSTLGASTNQFGASTTPQPSLTASITEPIGQNLPIFSILPPGPRTVDLDQSQPKKKHGFFVDVPTRSPLPRQMGYAPANSKLRGFGSSTPGSMNGFVPTSSLSFTSGKSNALSLNGSLSPDGMIVRSASPALGSGTRQSVKKVILDKKVEPSELFIKSGSPGSFRGGQVTFSLSVAAREKDAAGPLSPTAPHLDSPTPAAKIPTRTPSKFTAEPTHNASIDGVGDAALQEGDYYIRPELTTLKKASYDELTSFEGLVVGRVGYGEIHFLERVDLTGLSKLGALLGDVVRFDDKECSVYPDSEDVDKPPPGSGLNVKARLVLERCWANDKATQEPIKDEKHPTAVKHLKRLKNMKNTHFESFDMESGKWTFTVEHF
ncbi:hypothetical protein AN958_05620, partial [Leucoagaricus sp. SymC.cos]